VKTLVVYCHPSPTSFTAAVRDAVLAGLAAGHHEVRMTDLYAEQFDPVFNASDRALHLASPDTKPHLGHHADDLRWCESLVLVYPTWWSGQPAMLKGWIDRIWVNGVAWSLPEGANRLRPGLSNVGRISVVTTHGSSKFVNALEGETGKRVAFRSLRLLCSRLTRTRWIALYSIDACSENDRAQFLAKVTARLAR